MKKNNPAYKEVLDRPLPPDDPSTHFINPDTGEPMGYGSWRNGKIKFIHYKLGDIELPVTYVSVRIRGGAEVNGMPVMLLSVPKYDKELILALPFDPRISLSAFGIANEDLDAIDRVRGGAIDIPNKDLLSLLNNRLFGQQVLIDVRQDLPFQFLPISPEEMKQINKASEDILAFLNGNTDVVPNIFWFDNQQDNISLRLFVPQITTGEIQTK